MTAIEKAIKVVGSQQKLAEALNAKGLKVTQPSISLWVKSGKTTGRFAVAIEELTGIDREELCPINWGK